MDILIKQLLRESIIKERLTNVDSDVDLLYNKFFKNDVDVIQKTGIIDGGMFKRNITDTEILKDNESIESSDINKCDIKINYGRNYYSPSSQSISLSINKSAVEYVINDFNGDLNDAIKSLNHDKQNSLRKEFTEEKLKGSIHHELTHWIDDTMHNRYINKLLKKAEEVGSKNFNGKSINTSKMEINAQIHNIKQLYNKFKSTWGNLSFDDLISQSPTLMSISNELQSTDRNKWIRDLKTRMYREGILGYNMVNS